ncbi:MAG TPA: glycosyltransferase family 4 protein [Bacteroidota bacterium]|nr:glycosyltransferase family 4 protein [Bacteroidota bacterium]
MAFFVFVRLSTLLIKANKIASNPNSILYLENFPIENSGYQYRAKKWANLLNNKGINCEVLTILESKTEFDNALKNEPFSKFMLQAIKIRYQQCLYAKKFETVIVRRELLFQNDYGNLFMEKFLLKIHPNVILDFDDDISAAKKQPKRITNIYGKLLLEDGNKFNNTLRLYKRFIVASDYLKQKVLAENPNILEENILVIPTCVDYNQYQIKKYPQKIEQIVFGWIGGDHNYFLLDSLLPVLNKLAKDYDFKLIVIGGKKYEPNVNFEIEFITWTLATEVENLYKIDIGLMPLNDDARSRGKGGFKLIQYMGLGIVSVASAITINREIISHNYDSFLYDNEQELIAILEAILANKILLSKVGYRARQKIEHNYTFKSVQESYINFICQNNSL